MRENQTKRGPQLNALFRKQDSARKDEEMNANAARLERAEHVVRFSKPVCPVCGRRLVVTPSGYLACWSGHTKLLEPIDVEHAHREWGKYREKV